MQGAPPHKPGVLTVTVLSVTIQVTCQTCGAALSGGTVYHDGLPMLKVIPCPTCLKRADDNAWTKGYEKCWADLNGNSKVVA